MARAARGNPPRTVDVGGMAGNPALCVSSRWIVACSYDVFRKSDT
jgi:hypothetical protein